MSAVADLLVACPNIQIIVSSRVALHVYGEQAYRVPPMLLPGKDVIASATPESVEKVVEWEAVAEKLAEALSGRSSSDHVKGFVQLMATFESAGITA